MAKRGAPAGPILLTPELTKKLCDMLKIAVPAKYAVAACGISERTFHAWMEAGERGEAPYAEFAAAVTRARGEAVASMHVRALGGGKGSSAALWFLERRYWKDYAQHQRVEVTATDPLASMSPEEIEAQLESQRKLVAQYDRVKKSLNSAKNP